ncbi:MAG: endonuclease/exonuclease/phosphatase family protein [Bacteroidota bacterium]
MTYNSIKKITLSFIFLMIVLHLSAQENKFQIAIVGFYNLENLYDTVNDPNKNDEEFLPDGANRWTGERYKIKLNQMATAISRIGESTLKGGPAFMGVSEVENATVIQDLLNTEPLKNLKYGFVHYDCRDRRGVDVGFIYKKDRFKVLGSKSFPLITADTSFYTRDQLLVKGLLDDEEVYILVNHWPSRSGGEARSAPKRAAAADLTRSISDSLIKNQPNVKLIIMGDLNDDPTDASLLKHLKAKTNIEDVDKTDLYNPMNKLFKTGVGSLAYQDSWNLFDQIIVSYGITGKDFSSYKLFAAKIFNEDFLKQKSGAYDGYPFRTFVGGQFQGGFSDHFPVYLILARKIK